MIRTPAKDADVQGSGGSPRSAEEAGTSLSSVRRSIGEWEAGRVEPKAKSPANLKPAASQPTTHRIPGSLVTRRASAGAADPAKKAELKYPNLTAEARACLNKAKLHLGNSRNLKTEIKTEVLGAINRLYEIVKESEKKRSSVTPPAIASEVDPTCQPTPIEEQRVPMTTTVVPTELVKQLIGDLQQHKRALEESQQHTQALSEQLKKAPHYVAGQGPTFAEIAAVSKQQFQRPLHSVVVSSVDDQDTGEVVVEKLRTAVDAKNTGTRVERVRKVRDQKVVVSFKTEEELARVKERIKRAGNLVVEEVKNRDPLVIIKDVLSCHSDVETIEALKRQNQHLLGDVPAGDVRLVVKYRRKTRNAHLCHIILQVSPAIWQRLTTAGCVHIDLQRVRVLDQSPLVQCTRCLRYGHSRKLCTETADLCIHCGDPHMRADCPSRLAAGKPSCRNCVTAKLATTDHNAFDSECPIRVRWDALARLSVAYC